MLVLGVGLGGVMQVLVIIVQNGVPHSELGVATSGATFFRSIGGSFGTAIFGAIFSNVLVGNLANHLHALSLGPGAKRAYRPLRQADTHARRAAPAAVAGAAGANCSDRRTRRGPGAGAARQRPASGPGTRGGRCPPSAPRSHSRAAPGQAT
jgi:hypothetical protein